MHRDNTIRLTATTAFLSCLLAISASLGFDQSSYPPAGTIPIIFDTDMGPDIDDAGALAMLHAFADEGVCRIIAIGIDSPEPYSACCADAINTYYQRPDIPIGIVTNGPGTPTAQQYPVPVTEQFPNDLRDALDSIPDAVDVYRRALSQEEDGSVVIVAVGFKTILAQLLQSEADTRSPLNGVDLVQQKVLLWVDMGGAYPSGHEWNFYCDGAAASYAVAYWPTPVVFTGFEIGDYIRSGFTLSSMTPESNPVRKAYEIILGVGGGRSSWDQTAVLYACHGLADYWDIHDNGYNTVDEWGNNQWVEHELPVVDHSYLVAKMPNDEIGSILDSIMVQPPRGDPAASAGERSAPRLFSPVAEHRGAAIIMPGINPIGPWHLSLGEARIYDLRGRAVTTSLPQSAAQAIFYGVGPP